jgi:hypothetical protein
MAIPTDSRCRYWAWQISLTPRQTTVLVILEDDIEANAEASWVG